MSGIIGGDDSEEWKEQRRQYLNGKIKELSKKVTALDGYKTKLQTQHDKTNDNVYIPESEYDLSRTTDKAHWAGKLEEKGVKHQSETASAIEAFMGGIMDVIGLIEDAISDLNEKIGEYQSELNSL